MTSKRVVPLPNARRRLLAAAMLGIYVAATLQPVGALAAPTTPPGSLAQVPQFLPVPPAPNIVVTMDDSGSMRWAYAPDALCNAHSTRRAKSADFNPLYYDPRVRYEPPLRPDGSPYSTSFTHAWVNGFDPSRGARDLSADYKVTWTYDPASKVDDTTAYNSCTGLVNSFAENPAQEYNTAATGDQRQAGVPAYYYVYDPSLAGCTSTTSDDNCYRRVIVSATSGTNPAIGPDERQNFANWYSFYRTRNLLTVSAATRAFAALPPSARVAWQALNTCAGFGTSCDSWDSTTVDNRIRRFQGSHRDNFFAWLSRLNANDFTPLRTAAGRVGEYFSTSGVNSPYAEDPQVSAGTEHACRPNFHILMTDGIWNSDSDSGGYCSGSACGHQDNTNRTLPDGTAYDTSSPLTRIYRDGNANSVADIAFHYWATDLRPDLPNNQIPYFIDRSGSAAEQYWNPKNDPATWQHLVTFTVGLGLSKTLSEPGIEWAGSTYAGTGYTNLLSGAGTWPATGADLSPGNVYDLWHAAINSRGLAFSADRADELQAGFSRILQQITRARSVAAAGAASSSARLQAGNAVFTAEFVQGAWAGNLYRRELDPLTLTFRATRADGTPLPRDSNNQPYVWRVSDALPAPADRNIYTMRGGSAPGSPVVPFAAFALDAAQLAELVSPLASAADVIAYVRGDRSKELPGGNLRERPRAEPGVLGSGDNVLGTIANATPVYVKALDFQYDFLPPSGASASTGRETYLGYLRANQGHGSSPGRRGMIWTGSNGGMFHGFDGDTGQERFAYVPRSVLRNLPMLVDPAYNHRYLVDGVPAQGDAYFGSACPNVIGGVDLCWRTVVVSSLGAGGRSVFAIDATDPNNLGAASVLWELDEQSLGSHYASLGHVLGPAIIARVKDDTRPSGGRWVAVFGNGPESDNHRAALFVVDLKDGSVLRVLDTGNGSSSQKNGLFTPAPLFDANRQLIAVYAGDLRGNVWKFDLSSADSSQWRVAFGGAPLFTTRSPSSVGPMASRGQPQPVFARPLLRSHPNGGVMVIVGTGKLFSPGDRESEDIQTVYGVWDKPGETSGLSGNVRDGLLVQQAITSRSGSPATYFATGYSVNYAGGARGWYLDLGVAYSASASGVDAGTAIVLTSRERVVEAPIAFGQNLLVQSFVPSVDPCDLGGMSFLFRLDPMTGRFIGSGSFGQPNSAAVAMPGAFGLLPLLERTGAHGGDPRQRSGVVFSFGIQGEPSSKRVDLGGFGAFRTWRQLLD